MEPVLIYTDTEKIENEKEQLDDLVIYAQSLYGAFAEIDLEVSLKEMSDMTQILSSGNQFPWLENMVCEKLLDMAGEPTFNNVPIKREKLKEMISIPDVAPIYDIVMNDTPMYTGGRRAPLEIDLLQVIGGVVSKKPNAESIIENRNTHYSKNDRGAEVATKLFALAQGINSWMEYTTDSIISNWRNYGEVTLNGLEAINGFYRPDLNYIRKQEATYPNYVAVL